MAPSPSAPSSTSSRPLPLIIAGCVGLALCGLMMGAVGAGLLFLRGRGAEQAGPPAVEYVLDASPRMLEAAEGGTRLSVAQGVLAEIVRPASPAVSAGLRVFGTGQLPGPCQDTDLLVPLAPADQAKISDSLTGLQGGAGSDSALGVAMVAAIRDLAATRGPHSLVVVTGGADSCNPQAGQLIAQEAERQGIKLQLFVVGFEVSSSDAVAIQGVVDQTSGAEYLPADNANGLRRTLSAIQTYVDKPNGLSALNVVATAGAVTPGGTAIAGTPVPGPTATPQNTGVLQLSVLGYLGQPAEAGGRLMVQAYRPQDHKSLLATELGNPAALRLPAGQYDLQVSYLVAPPNQFIGGYDVQWVNGLSVQAGVTTTQSYDMKLGQANLSVLEAAGQPVPDGNYGFSFRIYHPDDLNTPAATVIVTSTATVQLTPGTYQVQVDFPGTDLVKQNQAAQTFEVTAGQSVDYAVNLKLGHLQVEVDDANGQAVDPTKLSANAFPAGTTDTPFAFSYSGNPADLALRAGKSYDVVLKLDSGQTLTLAGQQVEEGETKQVKVSVGEFK